MPKEPPKDRSPAHCNFGKGEITVYTQGQSEDKILSSIVFELGNLKRSSEHSKIKNLSDEEFVKEIERLEFRTAQEHHRVIRASIVQCGWNPSMDEFQHLENMTFEADYEHHRSSAHANNYRKRFARLRSINEKIDFIESQTKSLPQNEMTEIPS